MKSHAGEAMWSMNQQRATGEQTDAKPEDVPGLAGHRPHELRWQIISCLAGRTDWQSVTSGNKKRRFDETFQSQPLDQRLPGVLPACLPPALPGDSVLVLELSCLSSGSACLEIWLLCDVVGGMVAVLDPAGWPSRDLLAEVLSWDF